MIVCKEAVYNTTQSFYVEPLDHKRVLYDQVVQYINSSNNQSHEPHFDLLIIPFQHYSKEVCVWVKDLLYKHKVELGLKFHSINIWPRHPDTVVSCVR